MVPRLHQEQEREQRATLSANSELPCPCCDGRKIIIDPKEEGCPVEGHKMSRRIKCPDCGGTGETTVKKVEELYSRYVEEQTEKIEEYRRKRELYDEAVRKVNALRLNKEQLTMLGVSSKDVVACD